MEANWDKITTRDFIRIREIMHEEKNPVRKTAKVLEIATKHTYSDLLEMNYKELKQLAEDNEWCFTFPDGDIVQRFKFAGRRFDAILDAYKINAGQFIDGTELSKGSELESIRNLNILLGVLLEETTPRWKFWKKKLTQEEKIALVLDMPISYVYPNVVFFCRVWERLLTHIPSYLEKMAEELQKTAHGLSKDGGGE